MMLSSLIRFAAVLVSLTPLVLIGCDKPAPSTPTSMFDGLRESMVQDKPVLFWETMPATWQQDVDGLVHEFGKKVPAELYDRVMTTMKKLVMVMKDKKQFVMNTPMIKMQMSSMTATEKADAEKSYDAVVALGDALTSSDLSSASGLQKFVMTTFLTKYGPEAHKALVTLLTLASTQEPEAKQALEAMDAIKKMTAKVDSESGDTAMVTVDMAPLPGGMALPNDGTLPMSKVDGSWVPTPMVMVWPMMMSEAREQLANEDMSTDSAQVAQVTMVLGLVDAGLAHFENAKTQEQFDQAASGLMGMMGGGDQPGS
ncbi:MAG: hypothetical protein CMJ24_03375 [Phycisphaerae bacterium]|nr:hypothetical protein [Phycisphaerae bacterium]